MKRACPLRQHSRFSVLTLQGACSQPGVLGQHVSEHLHPESTQGSADAGHMVRRVPAPFAPRLERAGSVAIGRVRGSHRRVGHRVSASVYTASAVRGRSTDVPICESLRISFLKKQDWAPADMVHCVHPGFSPGHGSPSPFTTHNMQT